ncbi:MAG: dihydrodipicolinate synthase family protein [Candidatus Hydrogenedentes bacterium]|nr:dihydrodipicolinate synthase family protein [Candidatus Hydrogenedentota bacterium]
MRNSQPSKEIMAQLRAGCVIPAHPLALTAGGKFDERHQAALTRYYCHAGAGGVAVGVHTTQFAIREPRHGLFRPVIELASRVVDDYVDASGRPIIKVGGICGRTPQAVKEARALRDAGYHVGLLSLSALGKEPIAKVILHCKVIAQQIPLMGFYLQPAVGGRLLPVEFWRKFAAIENVVGIKIAPFNRYQTFDVLRGVAESGRADEIALYTGNDDNIVMDLLTSYRIAVNKKLVRLRFVGGLLGHWACWTRQAVKLHHECQRIVEHGGDAPAEMLTRANEVTDSNAAFFDSANAFKGCIAGIHYVLKRQGLMRSRRCLDPTELLSPGQRAEIERVYAAYPHLNDDAFVAKHIDEWLNA